MSQPCYIVSSCLGQWIVRPDARSTKEYTDLPIFIDSPSFPHEKLLVRVYKWSIVGSYV